jgi:hypothetical protein
VVGFAKGVAMSGFRRLVSSVSAATLVALFAGAASAQNAAPCGEREKILEHLAANYKEIPIARGLDSHGRVLEVLASEDGQTWTILVTMPNGITCLVESGIAFEQMQVAMVDPAA